MTSRFSKTDKKSAWQPRLSLFSLLTLYHIITAVNYFNFFSQIQMLILYIFPVKNVGLQMIRPTCKFKGGLQFFTHKLIAPLFTGYPENLIPIRVQNDIHINLVIVCFFKFLRQKVVSSFSQNLFQLILLIRLA